MDRGGADKGRALLDYAEVRPGERVLDLGADGGAVGFVLAKAAEVCFVSPDLRQVRRCEAEIGRLGAGNARAALAVSPAEIDGGPFDVALYRPPRWAAKERVFLEVDAAFLKMALGGRFCLAGRRDGGVESYRKRLEAVFGRVERVRAGGGLRVYRAHKEVERPGVAPVDARYAFEVADLPGGPYAFEAEAGVFSRNGLDRGTRLLLETVRVGASDRVLDLGCGYGAIGVAAARQAARGEAVLLDVNLLAVCCAGENVWRNGVGNARVALSDGFEAVPGEAFDLILSNPPTHEGVATARLFSGGAARHLKPGGRFAAVVRRPELYRKQMKRAFESVRALGTREGFSVLCASGPKGA